MKTYELDVAVTRGEETESEHRVHAAVVAEGDELLGAARDPDAFTYWRSRIKRAGRRAVTSDASTKCSAQFCRRSPSGRASRAEKSFRQSTVAASWCSE